MTDPWRVERADEQYAESISRFSCGDPDADDWIHRNAISATAAGRASTFLCCVHSEVVGVFTLTMTTVRISTLSSADRHGEQGDETPAALICWLALSTSHQKQHLLRPLLCEALLACVDAATKVPFRFIIIDALTNDLVDIYQHYGFKRIGLSRRLLMKTSKAKTLLWNR